MKSLKLFFIVLLTGLGSGALIAASGLIWLPQKPDSFGLVSAFFLLGWFTMAIIGYWALRFKALLNGTIMAVALTFAAYQGFLYLSVHYLPEVSYLDLWTALLLSACAALLLTKLIAPAPVRRAVVGGPQEAKKPEEAEQQEKQPDNLFRFKSKQTFYGVHVGLWAYAVIWIGLHWVIWFWVDFPFLSIPLIAELALVLYMPNWPLLIRAYDWQTRKFQQGKVHLLRPVL